jgi:hypothetical protein
VVRRNRFQPRTRLRHHQDAVEGTRAQPQQLPRCPRRPRPARGRRQWSRTSGGPMSQWPIARAMHGVVQRCPGTTSCTTVCCTSQVQVHPELVWSG